MVKKEKVIKDKCVQGFSTELACDYCGTQFQCEFVMIEKVKALCPDYMLVSRNTITGLPHLMMFCSQKCKRLMRGSVTRK